MHDREASIGINHLAYEQVALWGGQVWRPVVTFPRLLHLDSSKAAELV